MRAFGCQAVHERLVAFLDGELEREDARAVRQHLQACESCQRAFSELRSRLANLAIHGADDLLRLRVTLEPHHSPLRVWGGRGFVALGLLALCAALGLTISEVAIPELRRMQAPPKLASAPPERGPFPWPEPREAEADPAPVATRSSEPMLAEAAPVRSEAAAVSSATRTSPSEVASAVRTEPTPSLEPAAPSPAPAPAMPRPEPKKPKPPKPAEPAPLPKAARERLARLGVRPGYRFGELLFFPVVDATESGTGEALPGTARNPIDAVEAAPPLPHLIRVAATELYRERGGLLLPGTFLDAAWSPRLVKDLVRIEGTRLRALSVISALDPEAMIRSEVDRRAALRGRPARFQIGPFAAPVEVRLAVLEGQDNGAIRRRIWERFQRAPLQVFDPRTGALLVPQSTEASMPFLRAVQTNLRRLDPDVRDLVQRLRMNLRSVSGLRGFAMGIKDQPLSIDILSGPDQVVDALETLVRGLLLETFAEALFPSFGTNTGRVILRGREDGLDRYQALLQLFQTCRERAPRRYRGAGEVFGRKAFAHARVDESGRLDHAVILVPR